MNDDSHPTPPHPGSLDVAGRDALLASDALGAVTEAESRAAFRLRADDPDAAALHADFAAIAGIFPALYAEPDAISDAPGAALKSRVLAAARAEMRAPMAAPPPARSAPAPISLSDARAARRISPLSGWVVAAALLIAVIGLAAANLNLQRDVRRANNAHDAVQYAATGVHAYTMAGTKNAPNASATLVESAADGGKVVLLASGFPTPASGQTYRVWLQKTDGSYWPVGTFGGNDKEATTLVISGNLAGIHEVVITAEPSNQPGTAPSGPPVMQGELSA